MRLHRIALRDVKGVRRCDVTLGGGVTIVEGRNEVGKSTLAEALELLLEHYDTTTRSEVRALQPAGRDVGSEIEVEISTGPYRFTYSKRFNRSTETRLSVTAPAPERLTGREAHDRVREILEDTIDVDLWEALTVRQGGELEQAEVGHARALARAIRDRSSATAIGQREADLYERITDEYQRYWTPTGRESKALRDSAAAVEEAERRVADLEARLSDLERDIRRIGVLEGRIPELRGQVEAARRTVADRAADLRAVEGLEERVERHRLALQGSDAERASVAERAQARRDLVDQLALAREELDKRTAEADGDEERLDRARRQLTDARDRLGRARVELREAEALADRRRRDLDHRRDVDDLAQLRERRRRARAAAERRRQALAVLEDVRVDAELHGRLHEQHLAVERARGRLEVGSSTVLLAAETDLEVAVDGDTIALAGGDERSWTATDDLALRLPGVGTVTVRPGAGIEPLTRRLEEAEAELADLLARAGVEDLTAAGSALRQRRRAEEQAEAAARARQEALDGRSSDRLDEQIARLEQRVATYEDERPDEPAPPADPSEAARLRDAAADAARAARERFEEAEAVEQQAADLLAEVREAHTEREVQLQVARERASDLAARLDDARRTRPDEALVDELSRHDGAVETARRELRDGRRRLEAAEPDAVRTLATNAEEAAAALRTRLREAEDELGALRATVELRGGQGLGAALDAATGTLARLNAEDRSLRRRAEAARLLYETFTECRDEAKRAYAGPLRDRIARLGRILHGPSFDVTLDEQLRIEQRVLDGVPLPFEQLSAGAREQLALIGRLACAMLVADDGGAPLIVDDGLGHADPERLEAMGAILRLAGQECQVIVLTCYPERYRHVGGARTVRLA